MPQGERSCGSAARAAEAGAADAGVQDWFGKVADLLVPTVDRFDQLPERAALLFNYDAAAAIAAEDNKEVLAGEKTRPVIDTFINLI